jgi:hypothetical protein
VRVGFIVDKVALLQDFIPVFLFSLVIILPVLVFIPYKILCFEQSVKILLVVSPAVLLAKTRLFDF